ncbi:hypothetical protein [Streptomyces sp. NPDC101115]|uniref:hypothetical protein n=1 Tax=Streptomyces sp. NPDC101115 TaxID=3366106 RepID=UPI003823EAD6
MTTPAGGAAALKATSELLKAARELVGNAAPEGKTNAPAAESQRLDPGGLLSQARQAKHSYQATSRWILAAFAVVGLVLFGSLPFANIGKITGADLWLMGVGLVCAAAGIVLAIWAVSIVAEPLDASLGALEQRLGPAMKVVKDAKKKRGAAGDADGAGEETPPTSWRPRRRAEIQLATMLEGKEKEAHLGPGMASVSALIKELGELEKERLDQATAAARRGEALRAGDAAVSAHLTTLAELRRQADDVGRLDDRSPNKQRLTDDLNRRIQQESEAYAAAAGERAEQARRYAATDSTLAATQTRLDTYLAHREMVLVQSAMMQMRGTFGLARFLMIFGAALTLVGGTLYAYVLPTEGSQDGSAQSAERQPGTAAEITVNKDTDIAAQLPPSCVGRALKALRIDAKVPPPNGPFEVVVIDPVCPGTLSVPKDQGSIVSPATS